MKMQLPYFSNKQRRALVVFVVIIVLLQFVILIAKSRSFTNETANYKVDAATQLQIDSLKQLVLKKYEMQPFNPNFINDYKGFKLGMTTVEIDKLLKYRATGKYINSAAEFQQVTGVSTELLDKISPYFKFPEWTQNKKSNTYIENSAPVVLKNIDLNKATVEDLVAIKGIGDYYANAIINEREKLGGFVSIHQIDFIKGLRPEAVKILKQNTSIKVAATIIKVNVNTASKEDLAKIPYITSYLAREIVVYRSKQENPLKIEDLEKINNFPLDKLKIIKLYLAF
ncbi:helix-hairpin-helix domain-containing protein [Paenimyroides viscosum]|uniref:Helix-hairpin-helix domain-containing protein n=1 Tax=Paenimyroides viscosum TaxID=2488729 RepID=A0A3P1AQJ1_9FLAO|nr:helix-hairpin-helix domain-containing protein [Paenimyroides viscosum]RRA91174.1 helix-hairpin-helix domain-containing protein [Paenimyroides viscosum]